jgi:hypothetical protein
MKNYTIELVGSRISDGGNGQLQPFFELETP